MGNVDIEIFMQRLDAISARRKAMQSELARERHRVDELIAERRKNIEERRRKGDNGRAWQVLQQRIDMGETCESDILSGIDKSPEAREVRGMPASWRAICAIMLRMWMIRTTKPLRDASNWTNR